MCSTVLYFLSSYAGMYWSSDACFTPSMKDQMCQTVVREKKTGCTVLSGTGVTKVVRQLDSYR